ncbi:hypothetical protein W911_06070 [Hyphomicrobium nitrativorans NL23]|uniref:Uncharacterized protein n=1 Tax=Hyphomicrobium nitrativorans NL23 TaxID=1029756 RepID=V5SGM7_9HYPH|nr:hypothetical protein W911_06070 [Hyphomicrobium nitrativorans NL23]
MREWLRAGDKLCEGLSRLAWMKLREGLHHILDQFRYGIFVFLQGQRA